MSGKTKVIRIFISFSVISVFIFLMIGSGETSSNASSTKVGAATPTLATKDYYGVNESASINGFELTVTKVEKSSGTEFDKPKAGMEFVVVSVKMKNVSKDKISYNPIDYKMLNSKGQVTDETFSTINSDTALSSGDLIKGGEIEGSIIFEQPKGDSDLVLQYFDNLFASKPLLQFKLN